MVGDRDEDRETLWEWARSREATLRTFEVVLYTGQTVEVRAHSWSCDNPGGHALFYILESSGRTMIQAAVGADAFEMITDVTPPIVLARLNKVAAQMQTARVAEAQHDEKQRTPAGRRVH
jgi:hypothetical protein